MITIKNIDPPKIDLYSPDKVHLGLLNEYEFCDARVQIKESQLEGYYVVFNEEEIRIDKNGRLEEWPDGMFDQMEIYLMKLL